MAKPKDTNEMPAHDPRDDIGAGGPGSEMVTHDGSDIATVVKSGAKREHKATFAADKRNGGFCVRIIGPHANKFSGKIVPVTKRDDTETLEQLDRVVWTGIDTGVPAKDGKPAIVGTGKPVALYTFIPKPAVDDEILF